MSKIYTLRRFILPAATLSLGVLTLARAADTDSTSAADVTASTNLDQVVVSATRFAEPRDKTAADVTVITAEDLNAQQTLVVSDALTEVPGLAVARDGGPGQTTSLYIRGADPGQSAVLIDGIRINDPSAPDGSAVLSDLLVNNIKSIEVLRGPESTLYGSDAIGGVVNIITQRGAGKALGGGLEYQDGSYDTQRLNGNLNGTVGPLDYGAAANYYDTRGISAADARDGNSEPDGYRNLGATANLRWNANQSLSVDLRGFYTSARVDIDGYPPPNYLFQDDPEFGRNQLRALYVGVNIATPGSNLSERIAFIGTDSNRRYFGVFNYDASSATGYNFAPSENFYAEGGASRWEYQAVLRATTDTTITYGAETQLNTMNTESLSYDSAPTLGRDRQTGYYGQIQSTFAQMLTLSGGLRYDRDDDYGSHVSYKLGAALQPGDGTTVLRANYGNGFKAPTLYEVDSIYANPVATLKPETATGWEAGFDHTFWSKILRLSATYFNRGTKDEIEYASCHPGSLDLVCAGRGDNGYYYNIDRTRARGIESDLAAKVSGVFSLYLNYTNQTATDELTGLALLRRPHISSNFGFNWLPKSSINLGASVGYVGARYDTDPNSGDTVPLRSARTVNLYGSYEFIHGWQLIARLENIFDTYREPAAGYGALQRQIYAGIRASL